MAGVAAASPRRPPRRLVTTRRARRARRSARVVVCLGGREPGAAGRHQVGPPGSRPAALPGRHRVPHRFRVRRCRDRALSAAAPAARPPSPPSPHTVGKPAPGTGGPQRILGPDNRRFRLLESRPAKRRRGVHVCRPPHGPPGTFPSGPPCRALAGTAAIETDERIQAGRISPAIPPLLAQRTRAPGPGPEQSIMSALWSILMKDDILEIVLSFIDHGRLDVIPKLTLFAKR